MEVVFSNKANIIEAFLQTTHDNCPIFQVKSTFGLTGRKLTTLRDVNPIGSPESSLALYETHKVRGQKEGGTGTGAGGKVRIKKDPVTVGAIHWKEKIIEINGVKKKLDEVKKKRGLLNRSRYWKWAESRKEYEVKYDGDKEWVVNFATPSSSKTSKSKEKSKEKNKDAADEKSSSKTDSKAESSRSPNRTKSPSSSSSSITEVNTITSQDSARVKASGRAATFKVPYRPHIFHKSKSDPNVCTLNISREALEEDEVFLILVMIYSETRRQEGMNASVGSRSEGI